MSELREYFRVRRNEIVIFISFLEKIDQEPSYQDEIKILKSQAILMLYNLIEGTVNKGLQCIFDTINDDNLKHNEVSHHIVRIWMIFCDFKLDNKKIKINKSLPLVDSFINNNVDISVDKFRNINSGYFSAGNLDARIIREDILTKFEIGADIQEDILLEIKEERNFLAHGEKSFTEVGQGKSVPDMKVISNKVIDFLNRYVSEIENYINDENYKI